MLQIRRDSDFVFFFFFLLAVYVHEIFESAATRRSCEIVVCPGDWDLNPWPIVGSVPKFTDAVLDWLFPGLANTPTDIPKQTQADIEIQAVYSPAKDCDAFALPGSTDSQNVSPQNGFLYLQTFFWHVQEFENASACQKVIAHTIWPSDYANQAQHKDTADIIQSVYPNFLTSKHPNCVLEGGVGSFFGLHCSRRNKLDSLKLRS